MNVNRISNMGIGCNSQFGKQTGIADANMANTAENNELAQSKQISEEEQRQKADEFWMLQSKLHAEQTAAAISKVGEGQAIAIEIARRMSSGNKVSEADEKTLMGYDPNMYAAAKSSQMMAERLNDKSNDSLTDKFNEKHKNDRTDWTTELHEKLEELHKEGYLLGNAGASDVNDASKAQVSGGTADLEQVSIDICV